MVVPDLDASYDFGVPTRSRLERSQEARRQRVIDTVLDLARDGGYDAIQVRAVSDISLVGSDTIYRYFGSRDGMISAAVAQWCEREFFAPSATWLEGRTAAERLLSMSQHVWRAWEKQPNMLETYIRAAQAEGNAEDGISATSIATLTPVMASALDGVPDDYRDDVMMILARVTESAMWSAARGRLAVKEIYPIIERTVIRLSQHPAMQRHRPAGWSYGKAKARA